MIKYGRMWLVWIHGNYELKISRFVKTPDTRTWELLAPTYGLLRKLNQKYKFKFHFVSNKLSNTLYKNVNKRLHNTKAGKNKTYVVFFLKISPNRCPKPLRKLEEVETGRKTFLGRANISGTFHSAFFISVNNFGFTKKWFYTPSASASHLVHTFSNFR